jgi:isoquinoline 1-oxidoreductase beta subunit
METRRKLDEPAQVIAAGFSRRAILKGGALVLSAAVLPVPPAASQGSDQAAASLTAWIRIGPDDEIRLIASQSEMGQGTTTTLAAALADELYVPLEKVSIAFAPFDPAYRDPVYNWMFTGNSQSTSSFYEVMRRMGAAAREMLITAAANRWRVSVDSVDTSNGSIRHRATSRVLTFGVVAADAAKLPVPASPILRAHPPSAGRALKRWDIPSKVDGSAEFGIDVTLPGMLLAAVRCAPQFGAKLAAYDSISIKSKPGVVAVVEVPNGLSVVAKTYWQARRALDQAALTWSNEGSEFTSEPSLSPIYADRLASGPFFAHLRVGRSPTEVGGASTKLEAVYQVPFQAHAALEPMNCTARVAEGHCEVWAPTQGVEMAQAVAMQVTGLPGERVTVHRTMIGGGFGRRLLADFIKQTVLVAMAVKQPVKLIWSREEDMTHDFYRPAMLHGISGSLDASGRLITLAHRVVSPSHMLYILPRGMFPQMKDWTDPAVPTEKIDTMAVEGLMELPYEVPGQRVEQHRLELDVPVSVWRTTGHGPNNFVLESFIDELAFAAGKDPVAFRRSLLKRDRRALQVLNVAAEKSGWGGAAAGGASRGVALAKAFSGYIAAVAEVSVAGSQVKCQRLTMAVDCGKVLDPGIATSNLLGGAIWGLSGMTTAITFERGRAVETNFDAFEPLRLRQAPATEVHFVETGEKLGGTGELGPVPIHAAVCNAIFAATRQRVRSLPLSNAGLSLA